MASTLSAKSQQSPLHNFPIPKLKWPINASSSTPNTYFRYRTKPPNSTLPHHDHLDYATCHDGSPVTAQDPKPKIFFRIRTKAKSPSSSSSDEVQDAGDRSVEPKAEESKMWNLRPRKPPATKPSNGGAAAPLRTGAMPPAPPPQDIKTRNPSARPELSRSQAVVVNEAKAEEKKKKRVSILIPLSKKEIEEDFFAMTGSKPSRRPKKRARTVKKHLDSIFPGLLLDSIGPDSY